MVYYFNQGIRKYNFRSQVLYINFSIEPIYLHINLLFSSDVNLKLMLHEVALEAHKSAFQRIYRRYFKGARSHRCDNTGKSAQRKAVSPRIAEQRRKSARARDRKERRQVEAVARMRTGGLSSRDKFG